MSFTFISLLDLTRYIKCINIHLMNNSRGKTIRLEKILVRISDHFPTKIFFPQNSFPLDKFLRVSLPHYLRMGFDRWNNVSKCRNHRFYVQLHQYNKNISNRGEERACKIFQEQVEFEKFDLVK